MMPCCFLKHKTALKQAFHTAEQAVMNNGQKLFWELKNFFTRVKTENIPTLALGQYYIISVRSGNYRAVS